MKQSNPSPAQNHTIREAAKAAALSSDPLSEPQDTQSSASKKNLRFLKNNQYFTICIYAGIMLLISAIIFKSVMDIEKTKAGLQELFNLLSPFLLGALLAYVVYPLVKICYQLQLTLAGKLKLKPKKGFLKIFSILLTYLLVFGCIILILLYVLPEITNNLLDFINHIPSAYAELLDKLNSLQERFPDLDVSLISKPLTDTVPDLINSLRTMATNMVPALYTISMSIAGWIVNLLITIIVSIYMLYDNHRLMYICWRIIYAFLPKKWIPVCREILAECNRLFSSFVIGKSIDSLIIGILCFIIMTFLRLPYSSLISIVVGITNLIPYFGPFIGAIPGAVILLFISPLNAFIFIIMILCLQQFDGLILGPKILGESTGLKPLSIIFAISIGGHFAGVIGMFLGVPVVAIFTYLFDRYLLYRLARRNITEESIEASITKTTSKNDFSL